MNYYSISHEFDPKVIGKVEIQIHDMISNDYLEGDNSIYNMPYKTFPTTAPNLNGLQLSPKAKLTDILGCIFITRGLIINKRVKEILDNFNLPKHQFYPIVLHKGKKKMTDFFWFYYIFNIENHIDFEKSLFYETTVSLRSDLKMPVQIKNIDDYRYQTQIIKNKPFNRMLGQSRHKLQEEFLVLKGLETNLDILNTGEFGALQVASERLINTLKAESITGFMVNKNEIPKVKLN